MDFDSRAFRNALGRFPTGVAVITSGAPGMEYGMTCQSFSSLSLDPPLVVVCVDNEAGMLPILLETAAFTVNILNEHQEDESGFFATKTRPTPPHQFDHLAHHPGETGAARITGATTAFDCTVHSRPGGAATTSSSSAGSTPSPKPATKRLSCSSRQVPHPGRCAGRGPLAEPGDPPAPQPHLLWADPPVDAALYPPALWIPLNRLLAAQRRLQTLGERLPGAAWEAPAPPPAGAAATSSPTSRPMATSTTVPCAPSWPVHPCAPGSPTRTTQLSTATAGTLGRSPNARTGPWPASWTNSRPTWPRPSASGPRSGTTSSSSPTASPPTSSPASSATPGTSIPTPTRSSTAPRCFR